MTPGHTGPYRELVPMCATKDTYKYFLARDAVEPTWTRLASRYGEVRRNESFKTIEIECDKFFLRSTWLANPITVIRKRGCSENDVREFHSLLGFEES